MAKRYAFSAAGAAAVVQASNDAVGVARRVGKMLPLFPSAREVFGVLAKEGARAARSPKGRRALRRL